MKLFGELCKCEITTNDNIRNERLLTRLISFTLFTGCFSFVVFRSYQCFSKFLAQPKSVDISFQFAGKLPFPSITLCPPIANPDYPKPYNITLLKHCGLLSEIETFEGNLLTMFGVS